MNKRGGNPNALEVKVCKALWMMGMSTEKCATKGMDKLDQTLVQQETCIKVHI